MIHPPTTPQTLPAKQLIAAIEEGDYSPEELWDIQVAAAHVALEDGLGVRWVIDLPVAGVLVDENTILADEVDMVTARIGVPLHQLTIDGMMTNGRLIRELVRARLIVSMGKDEADADAILRRLTMKSLVEAVRTEVENPSPFEPSGTMHQTASFGSANPEDSRSGATASSE